MGAQALEYCQAQLPRFRRSGYARGHFFIATMKFLEGRSALSAACNGGSGGSARELLHRARRNGMWLMALQHPLAQGLGSLLMGEVEWRLGKDTEARQWLKRCAEGTQQHRARLFSLYAGRSLGLVEGGESGDSRVAEADTELRAEGIVNPASWSRIWVDTNER